MASGHKSTVTHSADASTNAMSQAVYNASKGAAANYKTVGADPSTLQAMGLFGDLGNAGRTGAAALGGDQSAISSLMNPYINQVLHGYNEQYGQNADMLRKNTDAAATASGAFGGDRAALEQGAQQGQLATSHLQQVADLLHGGYNDAMSRAGGLATLGMSAGNALMGGGDYMRQIAMAQANPGMMQQQLLSNGLQAGNVGNSSDTTYTKTSALQNVLGAAGTIGGMFGGIPGLGSIFGSPNSPLGSAAGAGLFGISAPAKSPSSITGFNFNPSMLQPRY